MTSIKKVGVVGQYIGCEYYNIYKDIKQYMH